MHTLAPKSLTTALRWLAHNCIFHPIAGVLWFAGDIALRGQSPVVAVMLWSAGDSVHKTTAPNDA